MDCTVEKKANGLCPCLDCHKVHSLRLPCDNCYKPPGENDHCRRCGLRLEYRTPEIIAASKAAATAFDKAYKAAQKAAYKAPPGMKPNVTLFRAAVAARDVKPNVNVTVAGAAVAARENSDITAASDAYAAAYKAALASPKSGTAARANHKITTTVPARVNPEVTSAVTAATPTRENRKHVGTTTRPSHKITTATPARPSHEATTIVPSKTQKKKLRYSCKMM